MGQKVHPYGFRLGVIKTWSSKWFEEKSYATWLHEDLTLKRVVKEHLANAGIAGIEIERAAAKVKVIIYTARPGIVIGKGGVEKVVEFPMDDGEKAMFARCAFLASME